MQIKKNLSGDFLRQVIICAFKVILRVPQDDREENPRMKGRMLPAKLQDDLPDAYFKT